MKILGNLIKYLCFVFLAILCLLGSLQILIQKASVQTYLVKEATKFLGTVLNTTVDMKNVYVDLTNDLIFQDVYIEDWDCDTLLFIKKLHINVSELALLSGTIKVKEVTLDRPYFRLHRAAYEEQFNMSTLFNQFSKSTTNPPKQSPKIPKPALLEDFDWEIALEEISILTPRFILEDNQKQSFLTVNVANITANIEQLDIFQQKIAFDDLIIHKPFIKLVNGESLVKSPEPDLTQLVSIMIPDWEFSTQQLQLNKGYFFLNQGSDTLAIKEAMNYKRLRLSDIDITIDKLSLKETVIEGFVKALSLKEESGFVLNNLSTYVSFTPRKLVCQAVDLKTPYSHLHDYFALKYKTLYDFRDFVNKVKLETHFENSTFTLRDITYFAAALHKVPLIQMNRDKKIRIAGEISNKISRIKSENLTLKIGETYFKGDVKMRGLPDFESTNIDFEVALLKTSIADIKSILPTVRIDQNFDKLGKLRFKGRFRGFPKDFVADGSLQTEIGTVSSDLNMKISAIPTYSGSLKVTDFELGTWLNKIDKVGNISFTSTIDGRGLKVADLAIKYRADIQNIVLNDYQYEDIKINNGKIKRKLFSGELVAHDEHFDLDFIGDVDFNDSIPKYNFVADIRNINFHKLNLVQRLTEEGDFKIAGYTDLNLQGTNIDNIQGEANFRNFTIERGVQKLRIKNLVAEAFLAESKRFLTIDSDIAKAKFSGNFTFQEVPFAFKNYLHTYFPYRFEETRATKAQDIDFEIYLLNPIAITSLFIKELEEIGKADIKGRLNTQTKDMELAMSIPRMVYQKNKINEFFLEATGNRDRISFESGIDNTFQGAKNIMAQINLWGEVFRDTIDFKAKIANDLFPNWAMAEGLLFANVDTFKLNFDTIKLFLNNQEWTANTGTFAYKNKDYFKIEPIELFRNDQRVTISSQPDKKVNNITSIKIANITLDEVNSFTELFNNSTISNLQLQGNLFGDVAIEDVFGQQMIDAKVNIEDFTFRNQKIGDVNGIVNKAKTDPKIYINATVDNDEYKFLVENGYYDLSVPKGDLKQLSLDVKVRKGQIKLLDAFIGDFVSNTTGTAKGTITVYGEASQPMLKGSLYVENAAFTVDYLKARYHSHRNRIDFDDKKIRFNKFSITDGLNPQTANTAYVSGYFNLNDYKNMNLAIDIETVSDRFLFMNTQLSDNELFYGKVYGSGLVRFTGPLNRLNLYVNATSKKGTTLYLPISYDDEVSDNRFFTFVSKKKEEEEVEEIVDKEDKPFSFNMDFDLHITPDAEMQIIFDLQAGDIIRGRGNGDIQVNVSMGEEVNFDVYGKYVISEGDYLFTLQNVVNKYFTVDKGGTITFSGDPYNAKVDVNAIYQLKTSRYDLLGEEEKSSLLANEQELRRRVPIDVYLSMKGSLMNPNIDFKIDQPEKSSSQADELISRKLRELTRNNTSELNKQIFGLLVLNRFMPPEKFDFNVMSGVNTTVSELLSNYVSNYLNDAISQLIPDSEFNLNWRNYNAENGESNDFSNRNELELMFTKQINDRLAFNIGGNLDVGEEVGEYSGIAVAGDVIITYDLTPDGKYQIKGFSKFDYDIFNGDYRKTGVSLFVNQEFDTFKDFWEKRKENKAKRKKEQQKRQEERKKRIPQKIKSIDNKTDKKDRQKLPKAKEEKPKEEVLKN